MAGGGRRRGLLWLAVALLTAAMLAAPSGGQPQVLGTGFSLVFPEGNLPTFQPEFSGPKLFLTTRFNDDLLFRPRFCNVPTLPASDFPIAHPSGSPPRLFPAWPEAPPVPSQMAAGDPYSLRCCEPCLPVPSPYRSEDDGYFCIAPNVVVPFLRIPGGTSQLFQMRLSTAYRQAQAASRGLEGEEAFNISEGTFAFSASSVSIGDPLDAVFWAFSDDASSPTSPSSLPEFDEAFARFGSSASGRPIQGYFCAVDESLESVWLRLANSDSDSPLGVSVNLTALLDPSGLPIHSFPSFMSTNIAWDFSDHSSSTSSSSSSTSSDSSSSSTASSSPSTTTPSFCELPTPFNRLRQEVVCQYSFPIYSVNDPALSYLLSAFPLQGTGGVSFVTPDPSIDHLRLYSPGALSVAVELQLLGFPPGAIALPWDSSVWGGSAPLVRLAAFLQDHCTLQFQDVLFDRSNLFLVTPLSGMKPVAAFCEPIYIAHAISLFSSSVETLTDDPALYENTLRREISWLGSDLWNSCMAEMSSLFGPANATLPFHFPVQACPFASDTAEYALDPCCNISLELFSSSCCHARPSEGPVQLTEMQPIQQLLQQQCEAPDCLEPRLLAYGSYAEVFWNRDPCRLPTFLDLGTITRTCQAQAGLLPCGSYPFSCTDASTNFLCGTSSLYSNIDGVCLSRETGQSPLEVYFSCVLDAYKPLLSHPYWAGLLLKSLGIAIPPSTLDFSQVSRSLHDFASQQACMGTSSFPDRVRISDAQTCAAAAGCSWGPECSDSVSLENYQPAPTLSCQDACMLRDESMREGQPSSAFFCGLCTPLLSGSLRASLFAPPGDLVYPSVCFDISMEAGCYFGGFNIVGPSFNDYFAFSCQAFNASINPLTRRCLVPQLSDPGLCGDAGGTWFESQFNTPEACAVGYCAQLPGASQANCSSIFICNDPLYTSITIAPKYDANMTAEQCANRTFCSSVLWDAGPQCVHPLSGEAATTTLQSDWGPFAVRANVDGWDRFPNASLCKAGGGLPFVNPYDLNQPCVNLSGCVWEDNGNLQVNMLQNATECSACGSPHLPVYHTGTFEPVSSTWIPLQWKPRTFEPGVNKWLFTMNLTIIDQVFSNLANLYAASYWSNYQLCRYNQVTRVLPQVACQCDSISPNASSHKRNGTAPTACSLPLETSQLFANHIMCPPETRPVPILDSLLMISFSSQATACLTMAISRSPLPLLFSRHAVLYPSLFKSLPITSKYQLVRNPENVVMGWALGDGYLFSWNFTSGNQGLSPPNVTYCSWLDPWIGFPAEYSHLDFGTFVEGGSPKTFSPAIRPLYRGTLWLAISRTVPSMPPTSLLGDLSTGLEAFPGEPTRATLLAAFSASQNVYLCAQIESDGTVLFPIARVRRASDVSYFEMLPPGEQAALTMALILFCITAAITVVRLVAMAKYHGLMIFNMPRLILGLLLLSLVFQIVYYALVATHAIDRMSLGDMFFSTFPGYINFSIFIVLLGCWIEDIYLNYPTGLLLLIRHRLYWSDIFFYSLFLVNFIVFASIPDSWPDWTLTNCQEYSYSPRAITTIVFNSLVTSLSLPLGFLLLGYATFMFFRGRANAFPRGATPFLLLSFFYISAFIGQSIYLVYYSVSKEQLHLSPSVACTLIISLCPAILLLITLRHGTELAQPVVDPFADSRPLVRENMSDAHDTDDDDDDDEDETVR